MKVIHKIFTDGGDKMEVKISIKDHNSENRDIIFQSSEDSTKIFINFFMGHDALLDINELMIALKKFSIRY